MDRKNADFRYFSIGLKKAIAEYEFNSERDFAKGLMHITNLGKDLSLDTSTNRYPQNRQNDAERPDAEAEDSAGMGGNGEDQLSYALDGTGIN